MMNGKKSCYNCAYVKISDLYDDWYCGKHSIIDKEWIPFVFNYCCKDWSEENVR